MGKSQLALDFPFTEDELVAKLDQGLEETSKFLFYQELNIPYYFGTNNLIKISSFNIEQFLSLAAELFEEMLSSKIAGKSIILTAKIQEKIIKFKIDKYWNDLNRRIPYGNSIRRFLEKFSEYARNETYKENSPINQGVTGFSITISNQEKLFSTQYWYEDINFEPLLNVISTCIAYNLLETRDIVQGAKGQVNQVFYLNRILCLKFNLPIQYGGWKHRKLEDLLKWADRLI